MKRFAKSQAELAAILRLSTVMLNRHSHAGCPCAARDKDKRGRYRVLPVRQWIEANVLGRDAEEVDWARLRRAEADERQARAKIAQMKVERMRGELVRLEDVKDTLLIWSRSLAPRLSGKTLSECQRVFEAAIRDVMSTIAEQKGAKFTEWTEVDCERRSEPASF